jgi:TrmH family RNA methyltransferase
MTQLTRITSPDNNLYRSVKKLIVSARERRKTRRAVLDGWHLLDAYRAAHGEPERVLIAERAFESKEAKELVARIGLDKVAVLEDGLFDSLAPVEEPTGVLTLIEIPHLPKRSEEFCLLLEDIQDPGNLGSMLRTAAAAGVDTLYLSKGCADAWSPKVLRGGMGAHFHLALNEHIDLTAAAEAFKGHVIATSLQATASLYELDLKGPVAFVFGNEGAGLSEALLAVANHRVRIPMSGQVESLNAAAAVAICLFERVRQTKELE